MVVAYLSSVMITALNADFFDVHVLERTKKGQKISEHMNSYTEQYFF